MDYRNIIASPQIYSGRVKRFKRLAHNQETSGSTPVPATSIKQGDIMDVYDFIHVLSELIDALFKGAIVWLVREYIDIRRIKQ